MKSYKATGELQTFRCIWMSNKRSFISGLPLGQFSINFFAHVLSKKQFPHFRLYLGGIRTLSSLEHTLLDSGTESQRISYSKAFKTCDWQKLYTLEDELRELYADTFPAKGPGGMIMKYSEEEVSEKIRSLNRSYLDTLDNVPTDTIEQIKSVLLLGSEGQ